MEFDDGEIHNTECELKRPDGSFAQQILDERLRGYKGYLSKIRFEPYLFTFKLYTNVYDLYTTFTNQLALSL